MQRLIAGYESLLQGILIPVVLAFVTSFVRVALFGWHGARDYFASLTVACFLAVCAAWLLSLYDFPMPVNAVVICLAGIFGRDAMQAMLTRKTLAWISGAIRRRLCFEILYRGRGPHYDGGYPGEREARKGEEGWRE